MVSSASQNPTYVGWVTIPHLLSDILEILEEEVIRFLHPARTQSTACIIFGKIIT